MHDGDSFGLARLVLKFPLLSSYSTIYTMAPVFFLVLDEDIRAETALLYPELYKELLKVSDNRLSVT